MQTIGCRNGFFLAVFLFERYIESFKIYFFKVLLNIRLDFEIDLFLEIFFHQNKYPLKFVWLIRVFFIRMLVVLLLLLLHSVCAKRIFHEDFEINPCTVATCGFKRSLLNATIKGLSVVLLVFFFCLIFVSVSLDFDRFLSSIYVC